MMDRAGVHSVSHKAVLDVEVRHRSVQIQQIWSEGSALRTEVTGVIDVLTESVVRLELQAMPVALRQRNCHAVVVRASGRRGLIVLNNLTVRRTEGRAWLGNIEGPDKGINGNCGVAHKVAFLNLLNVNAAVEQISDFEGEIMRKFLRGAGAGLARIGCLEVRRYRKESAIRLIRPR